MARALSLRSRTPMTSLPHAALLLMSQAPNNAVMGPLFMYAAIFAIFYFVLIRPQQRQRKQQEAQLGGLKKGDEIVTTGGVIGEVVHIRQNAPDKSSMEDRITIKTGDTRILIERRGIARVVAPPAPASQPS